MTDVLDLTGISGCNKAWNDAITTLEEMIIDEGNWEWLSEKLKLCSSLNGTIQEDVRGFNSNFNVHRGLGRPSSVPREVRKRTGISDIFTPDF